MEINVQHIQNLNYKNESKNKFVYKEMINSLSEKHKIRLLKLAEKVLNLNYEDFYKLSGLKFPKRSFERIKEEYKKSIFYNEIKSSLKTKEYFISDRSSLTYEETTFEELKKTYESYKNRISNDRNDYVTKKGWIIGSQVFIGLLGITAIPFTFGASAAVSGVVSGTLLAASVGTSIAGSTLTEKDYTYMSSYIKEFLENYTQQRLVYFADPSKENLIELRKIFQRLWNQEFIQKSGADNEELNDFINAINKNLNEIERKFYGHGSHYGNY
ncbi:hypothetical protein [Mycoplasma sp. 1012]